MKYFIIFLFSFTLTANSLTEAQIFNKVGNDVIHFFNTGGALATHFVKFDKQTQANLAETALLIGASYAVDYNSQSLALSNRSPFDSDLFSVDKVYGSGYTLIGIAGLYGYGVLFNNEPVRKIGLETIEAVGYAGLITSVIKSLVGRSRPYTGEGKFRFRPFNVHAAYTSFPSGHSTVAFAVSTVLANNTDNIYLKILCFSASGLVAASRIYHNAHWLSDVVTGGAIGYFVGNFVTNHDRNYNPSGTNFSLNLAPNGIGFTLNF